MKLVCSRTQGSTISRPFSEKSEITFKASAWQPQLESSPIAETPFRILGRVNNAHVMLLMFADVSRLPMNNYDLGNKFEDKKLDKSAKNLIPSKNRNYINTNYYVECGRMSQPSQIVQRRTFNESDSAISFDNINYYSNKLWPLGVVLFGFDDDLIMARSQDYKRLIHAMAAIEQYTCIVFQKYIPDDSLDAKSYIWFDKEGEDMPLLGFSGGKQSINLSSFLNGAPGHTAHAINNLLRILGIHMMSNRYDRDNYVTINWDNVEKGKEQYLERSPEKAWIASIPYDFDSVTHAPANYMCSNCDLGDTTVQPLQDHLWQRTFSMGHRNTLSDSDIRTVNLLYNPQCNERYTSLK
ncbi:seminal metalloprotease 1-like [Melitaea cinxia]|uniref:seminal metalloprotease 1-like n=1 Tax=Melitaea cinxia TaxID=113334 RepID=UPI001E2745D4|nr:seminal metalloprotease 1-like [Melitaea cinxia]